MTEFEPTDWEARLAERMAEFVKRQEARKAERNEFARRRAYGLVQRHGTKLARIRRAQQQQEEN